MTDSATQYASPQVKNYHGSETIPIGRRLEPKPSLFFGLRERRNFFVSRGNTFLPPPGERASHIVQKKSAAARATRYDDIRFVWANSVKRAKIVSYKRDESLTLCIFQTFLW